MSETITAIVENGMLRPETPLALADGTRVQITVSAGANGVHGVVPSRATKDAVKRLAAMPLEPGPQFSGRDHDRILYGDADDS